MEVFESWAANLGTWPKVRMIFEAAGGQRYEVVDIAAKLIQVQGRAPKSRAGSAWRMEGGLDLVSALRRDGEI